MGGYALMQMKKILEKFVALKLESLGFYPEKSMKLNSWVYSRKYKGVTQYITFFKSRVEHQAFRVELSTSLKKTDIIYGHQFIKRAQDWWYYTDDESLQDALDELLSIVLKYGLQWLELKSTPDLEPNEDIGKQLVGDPEKRAGNFERRFGLDVSQVGTIKKIEEILLVRKKEIDEEVDWDLILDASAYLGELIRTNIGGSWGWNEDYSTPAILEIGPGKEVFNVLKRVSRFWSKPTLQSYSLVAGYESLM